jgi:hypothetical protein
MTGSSVELVVQRLIECQNKRAKKNVTIVYGDMQKLYTDTPETHIGNPEIDFFSVRLFRYFSQMV